MNLRDLSSPNLAAMVRGYAVGRPDFEPLADEVANRLCAASERAHRVRTACAARTNSAPKEGGLGGGESDAKEPLVSQKRGSEEESEQKQPKVRAGNENASAHTVRTQRTTRAFPPIPQTLDVPAFQAAWAEWMQYRASKGKPVSAHAAFRLLAKCSAWGPDLAVTAINNAISNDWQGLFEPKENVNGRKSLPDHRAAKAAREYDESELYNNL